MAPREVVLEALSVLTGREVKPIQEFQKKNPGLPVPALMSPKDFLNFTLLSYLSQNDDILQLKNLFDLLLIKQLPALSELISQELFVNDKEFFDPRFDYDFTNIDDGPTVFKRGNELYKRPCGWNRIALKVLDKYPDGNAWLGTGANAWPVSYHGTSIEGAKGIIRGHYRAGPRALYGRGIYSTPNLDVARYFTKTFVSKINHKTYEVMMQNRINPKKRTCTTSNFWLVAVSEGTSPEDEREIVECSIRPYGLLLREVAPSDSLKGLVE